MERCGWMEDTFWRQNEQDLGMYVSVSEVKGVKDNSWASDFNNQVMIFFQREI